MRQYLSSLVVVLLGIACGGTTDSGDQGGAGSPAGGTGNGTQGGRSAAGSAGKSSAGSSSGGAAGTATGSGGYAGTLIIGYAGTSTGGSGVVNPLCPAHQPMGMCSADDAGVSCQYEPGSGCLCYPTSPGTFALCQKVDPTCAYMAPGTGGTGGTAGAAGQSTGGISAKIALPPQQRCSCSTGTWVCTFGV